ncbi:MAG: alpha-L-fucosidase [Bacteroidota bacterium]|nr:alpha-L-fucosidase [Bacteroidota bacterium]
MKKIKGIICVFSLLVLFQSKSINAQTGLVHKPALPSPQQVQWQNMERTMFVHFAPNTWQGTELDNRSTPLSRINPTKLDVNQWIDAAESFGAKMIIFVAKHVGGFCMWQTESTDYSIKNTPYKNGKGDVLDELAKACFQRGMRLGVYIYPGDDTWGAYLGGGGKTKDPSKQEAYNKVLRMQWEEVLSRYGNQIHEIWYDGGLVVPLEDIVKKYAPNAIVFQGPFASIRWVGNEQGIAPYPAWNSVKAKDAKTGVATGDHGDPDGEVWMPLEVDVTLKNHNWFWSPTNYKNLRNLDQLMEIYYKSVGRGGLLLLNAAPDTTGLIPAVDMKLYKQFGDEINRRFGNSLASTSGKGESLELKLVRPEKIDHVIIQEDIVFGERIREYIIEGQSGGKWIELANGTSIGYKRIERFNAVEVSAIRVRFTQFSYQPVIEKLSAYYVGGNAAVAFQDKKDEVLVDAKVLDKSGKFEVDLSGFIKMAGQYKLVIRTGENENLNIRSSNLILQGISTPGFTRENPDGSCNINITAHPSGGKGSIILTGQVSAEKQTSHQKVKFYILKK